MFKKSIHDTLSQPISSSLRSKSEIQIIFDCCVIFFYFRPKSRPFLEKADFLRKKKTLFALFFQKGLLSRPRSTKEDPVGITENMLRLTVMQTLKIGGPSVSEIQLVKILPHSALCGE